MRHAEPTGLKRLLSIRTFWGRERLVLQIQERGLHTSYIGGHVDTQWVTRWRDATSADLTITEARLSDMLSPAYPAAADPHRTAA